MKRWISERVKIIPEQIIKELFYFAFKGQLFSIMHIISYSIKMALFKIFQIISEVIGYLVKSSFS